MGNVGSTPIPNGIRIGLIVGVGVIAILLLIGGIRVKPSTGKRSPFLIILGIMFLILVGLFLFLPAFRADVATVPSDPCDSTFYVAIEGGGQGATGTCPTTDNFTPTGFGGYCCQLSVGPTGPTGGAVGARYFTLITPGKSGPPDNCPVVRAFANGICSQRHPNRT